MGYRNRLDEGELSAVLDLEVEHGAQFARVPRVVAARVQDSRALGDRLEGGARRPAEF